MNYRSVSDLGATAREMAQSLPTDIDLIVGIPRSGLLAANLLCLYLDRPMTDIDGLCEGRLLQTGHRYEGGVSSFEDLDRVLVLDDSVNSGTAMTETKERLEEYDFPFELEFGALYITQNGHNYVDYWGEIVTIPRIFEWNLLHHPAISLTCMDIDGVLCRDPTPEENDDGPNYREFIRTVEPRTIPSQRVGWLVTSRLEKYRPETEQWLDEHGIEYDELVMLDMPDMESRQKANPHADFKADVYESTGASLFIESDKRQAKQIAEQSRRPVFCYDTNEMVQPGFVADTITKGGDYLERLTANPTKFVSRAGSHFVSQGYNRLSIAAKRYRR